MIYAKLEIIENNENIDHYFIRSLVNVLHCKGIKVKIRSKKKFDLLVDEQRIDSEFGDYKFEESKLIITYSSFNCELPLDRPIEKVIENVEEIYSLLLTSNYMKDDYRLSFLKRDVKKYLDEEFKIETQNEEPIIKDRTMVVIYNEVDSQASAKMMLDHIYALCDEYEYKNAEELFIEVNAKGFKQLFKTSYYDNRIQIQRTIDYLNNDVLKDEYLYLSIYQGYIIVKYNTELDTYKQSVFRIVGKRKDKMVV